MCFIFKLSQEVGPKNKKKRNRSFFSSAITERQRSYKAEGAWVPESPGKAAWLKPALLRFNRMWFQ